jgi:hypothetical protein
MQESHDVLDERLTREILMIVSTHGNKDGVYDHDRLSIRATSCGIEVWLDGDQVFYLHAEDKLCLEPLRWVHEVRAMAFDAYEWEEFKKDGDELHWQEEHYLQRK